MADRGKRISGQDMDSAGSVEYAEQRDGRWHIGLTAVRARVDAYLKEAAEAGRYSISGLCIALGVTRETLRLWRMGYVSAADEQRARVLPNGGLADIIAWAELHVHRYWEECDESRLQSKHTKLLESAGVVGERAKNPAHRRFRLTSGASGNTRGEAVTAENTASGIRNRRDFTAVPGRYVPRHPTPRDTPP